MTNCNPRIFFCCHYQNQTIKLTCDSTCLPRKTPKEKLRFSVIFDNISQFHFHLQTNPCLQHKPSLRLILKQLDCVPLNLNITRPSGMKFNWAEDADCWKELLRVWQFVCQWIMDWIVNLKCYFCNSSNIIYKGNYKYQPSPRGHRSSVLEVGLFVVRQSEAIQPLPAV